MLYQKTIIALNFMIGAVFASPLPIDPIWQSESFLKAYTASYGIDSRIEPNLSPEEKKALESVAEKMGKKDRLGAISLLSENALTEESPALLFNLASLLFEQGQAPASITNFTKAIKLQPNFRDAHRNMAIALVQEGDFIKAEPSLRRAIELGAQDGLTMGLLGYCLNQSGKTNDALQAYRMAKLTMPKELQWQIGEATALMELGSYAEAASIYESVLKDDPERVGIWVNLANIRLQQGESVQAIADLEVARRLGGLDPIAMITLGHLYLNEELSDQAIKCYEKSLEDPEAVAISQLSKAVDYLLQYRLWSPAEKLSSDIKAVVYLKDKIDKDDNINHRFKRADAIIQMNVGDRDQAAKRLENIIGKDPLDGEVLLMLSEYFLGDKETEKGLMLLEQASQVQGFTARSERRLGEVYVSRGDYNKALSALKKSQDLEPHKALEEYIESVERLSKLYERN